MIVINKIKDKWNVVFPHLNEKAIRLWAASEALSLEKFRITDVSAATGISRITIYQGIKDIKEGLNSSNIRKKELEEKRLFKTP